MNIGPKSECLLSRAHFYEFFACLDFVSQGSKIEMPQWDYTSPDYITLLVTGTFCFLQYLSVLAIGGSVYFRKFTHCVFSWCLQILVCLRLLLCLTSS